MVAGQKVVVALGLNAVDQTYQYAKNNEAKIGPAARTLVDFAPTILQVGRGLTGTVHRAVVINRNAAGQIAKTFDEARAAFFDVGSGTGTGTGTTPAVAPAYAAPAYVAGASDPVFGYGQSLMVGASDANLAASYNGRDAGILQLAGMTRSGSTSPTTTIASPGTIGWDDTIPATGLAAATTGTAIPPLMGYAFARNMRATGVARPVLTNAAISGISLFALDDDPNTTPQNGNQDTTGWRSLAHATRQMAAQTVAAGVPARMPRMMMLHGNADATNTTVAMYKAQWANLLGDWVALCQAQGMPAPRILLTQTAGDSSTINTGELWNVCQAQNEIAIENANVLYVGSDADWVLADGVHPTAEDSSLIGDRAALIESIVDAGGLWITPQPVITGNGSSFTIDFGMPSDETLVDDPSGYADFGGAPAFMGFEVSGGGAITSATITGARQVTLQTSGIVSQIQYQMQAQDVSAMTNAAGHRKSAHRGTLRSNKTWPSVLFPTRTILKKPYSFRLAV